MEVGSLSECPLRVNFRTSHLRGIPFYVKPASSDELAESRRFPSRTGFKKTKISLNGELQICLRYVYTKAKNNQFAMIVTSTETQNNRIIISTAYMWVKSACGFLEVTCARSSKMGPIRTRVLRSFGMYTATLVWYLSTEAHVHIVVNPNLISRNITLDWENAKWILKTEFGWFVTYLTW